MITIIDLPCGRRLDLSGAPAVMAVVNCTTDSFYAGSHNASAKEAIQRARDAENAGAALIDFGAESTRPGAEYVSAEEECRRLIPVIEGFRKKSTLPVSVDTRKVETARRALDAGADIINDISALEDEPAIGALCAERGAAVLLMHKQGEPGTMQVEPHYNDVVKEVVEYLAGRAAFAESCGIPKQRIILDPGIGFGKNLEHNLALVAHFDRLAALGYPALMALSRKTFIGQIVGKAPEGRLAGTLAANAYAISRGAQIIRVHDVPEAVDLARVFYAISKA
jgi:dihydropteroate synthase